MGIFRDSWGCFSNRNSKKCCPAQATTGWAESMSNLAYSNIYINASQSNSIYGNSSTVQPFSVYTYYCIKY